MCEIAVVSISWALNFCLLYVCWHMKRNVFVVNLNLHFALGFCVVKMEKTGEFYTAIPILGCFLKLLLITVSLIRVPRCLMFVVWYSLLTIVSIDSQKKTIVSIVTQKFSKYFIQNLRCDWCTLTVVNSYESKVASIITYHLKNKWEKNNNNKGKFNHVPNIAS